MWIPSRELLAETDKANAFLVCRWDEFFDSHTPDTYQPRICHLPVLVTELAEVAGTISPDGGLRKHLNHIKEEARLLVKEDDSFFRLCDPVDREVLAEIASENTADAVVTSKAAHLRDGGFQARYEKSAIECGQIELVQRLAKASVGKRGADRWLGLWATIALHRRYVWSKAYRPRDSLRFTRSTGENIAEIANGLTPAKAQYVCLVAVTARPERGEALPGEGETPLCVQRLKTAVNAAGIRIGHHGLLPERTPKPHELLLVGHESGVGPIDALAQFVRRLQPMLNVLGFYRGAAPAEPILDGWAGPSLAELAAYRISSLSARQLHPRRKALRLVKRTWAVSTSGRLDGVLANALELHNVAILSTDLRVQFMTMWSALECLASTVPGRSVISRVMDLLLPIVSWRRIEKQIRYLAFTLRDWQATMGDRTSMLRALPNSTREEVLGEDVLLAVTRPADHPELTELFGAIAAHPLLLWRASTTWEVFHDPAKLARDLARARNRLAWHLGRIYQARNQLVHLGVDSPLLPSLLDNLQYYLSTAISRLLHGVALNPANDAARAAAYWRALADRVQMQLREAPAELKVEDVIANPRLYRDHCPWGTRP